MTITQISWGMRMKDTEELFTIGHSNHSAHEFIKLLQAYNITCVVDVRSSPYSKHVPQFNKEELKKNLVEHGIQYVSMAEEFGARRSDLSLFHTDGYLDFAKTAKSAVFLNGIARVVAGMHGGFRIALMCTEQNPLDCHRFSLVSRSFSQHGICVKHILPDGTNRSQEQVEESLLNEYFPETAMVGLFEEEFCARDKLLSQAYALNNEAIGYRRPGNYAISDERFRC